MKCKTCDGIGKVDVYGTGAPPIVVQCPDCEGTGTGPAPEPEPSKDLRRDRSPLARRSAAVSLRALPNVCVLFLRVRQSARRTVHLPSVPGAVRVTRWFK